MEKAYAKAFGTYHKIEAGLTGQAIRDLTGAPCEFITTDEGADKVWNFINFHDDDK
jgi:calpain-15